MYQGWYESIGDDVSDKTVGIEAEVKIEIRSWSTQWRKGLLYLIRELELDK